jgi:RNA polymerase sigma-70 factor, ECF subfamily
VTATSQAALSLALARLARGDRSAQRAVFEAAWPLVRGFCRRMLRDVADSEDAAQRALIRLFEQASHYDLERDGLTWALEIALW